MVAFKPVVYAVVLNWNGKQDTVACVNAILSNTYKTDVVLVDNGSTDGSMELFKSQGNWKGRVEIIQSGANLGCGGNNIGIKRALEKGAEYVFIDNNDAFPDKDAIEIMVEAAAKNPEAAIISPLILYYGTQTVWCAGCGFNNLIYKARLLGTGKAQGEFTKPTPIDYAVGAVMLVKAQAIRKAGLFDEKLFYYYEETKWQMEMRKLGYGFVLEPRAVIRHKVGSSSGGGRTPLSSYYIIRNRGWFIRDEAPAYIKPIAYASLVGEALVRLCIALPSNPKVGTMAIRGLADFIKGRTGKFVQ